MIAQARSQHRFAAIFIALVAPSLLLTAILTRPEKPIVHTLPPILVTDIDVSGEPLAEHEDLIGEVPVTVRLYARQRSMILEVVPRAAIQKPELAVMWQASDPERPEFFMLGELAGTRVCRFVLPRLAGDVDGTLLFYSNASGTAIGSTPLATAALFEETISTRSIFE